MSHNEKVMSIRISLGQIYYTDLLFAGKSSRKTFPSVFSQIALALASLLASVMRAYASNQQLEI